MLLKIYTKSEVFLTRPTHSFSWFPFFSVRALIVSNSQSAICFSKCLSNLKLFWQEPHTFLVDFRNPRNLFVFGSVDNSWQLVLNKFDEPGRTALSRDGTVLFRADFRNLFGFGSVADFLYLWYYGLYWSMLIFAVGGPL